MRYINEDIDYQKEFINLAFSMLVVYYITQVILLGVYGLGIVPTGSMMPTINPGDKIGIWRLETEIAKVKKDPMMGVKRGDIVVFTIKEGDTPYFEEDFSEDIHKGAVLMTKRLIAVGGDTVEIQEGKVIVNGKELEEEYVSYGNFFEMSEITVPEGEMFLLGDNRSNSYDSRLWTKQTVPMRNIEGKVVNIRPSIKQKIKETAGTIITPLKKGVIE